MRAHVDADSLRAPCPLQRGMPIEAPLPFLSCFPLLHDVLLSWVIWHVQQSTTHHAANLGGIFPGHAINIMIPTPGSRLQSTVYC